MKREGRKEAAPSLSLNPYSCRHDHYLSEEEEEDGPGPPHSPIGGSDSAIREGFLCFADTS